VKRQRKVDPYHFVLALVFGFALGPERTIAGLRRAFLSISNVRLVNSSFFDRFTDRLVRLMAELAAVVIERTAAGVPRDLTGPFKALSGLLAIDSTLIHLHDLLQDTFPGSRHNTKAAVKLHTVMNATAWRASVWITDGRASDVRSLKIGEWVKNKLLLLDCAYFSYALFERIRLNSGLFVVPLPAYVNPEIRSVAAGPERAEGKRLREVVARFRGPVLDVDGIATYRWSAQRRAGARRSGVFRYVGIRNEATGELWLCATNLPRDRFSAEAVASIYRARWLVELLFKSLKNDLNMDQIPTTKPEVAQCLIYASLIAWAVSNALREEIAATAAEPKRVTPQRWARLVRVFAPDLLKIAGAPRSKLATYLAACVERVLRTEAIDPHRARATTLSRALREEIPRNRKGRETQVA
jgi:IS4 transposase